ncbi:MAG: glycogen synthase [Nitrospirae bacterium]|nr:MAG: glycogen synthase [Nitrospirota bacterium]
MEPGFRPPDTKKLLHREYRRQKKCKLQLLKDCSIKPDVEMPVAGMVGRLSSQKGMDLVLESIGEIISTGVNLVILGRGDDFFQKKLSDAVKTYKGRVYVNIGFEDHLAHKIYAGADIFLMPSLYEPCGLGQLIAMRYGTIPVARKTGGLADTVMDYEAPTGNGTGFLFSGYAPSAFSECLKRAICVYSDKLKWQKLILNAMKMDFSWGSSAKKYIELYSRAIKLKRQ